MALTQREQTERVLFDAGFTQFRYDIGASRGQLSSSYRNQDLNLNIILGSCTLTVLNLSTGATVIEKMDILELCHLPTQKQYGFLSAMSREQLND